MNTFAGAGGLSLFGASTASFYRLDPTGTVPVEPIADIVPGVSPLRITLDLVTALDVIRRYRVTQFAVQDLVDVTPHKKRELRVINIEGVLTASPIIPTPEIVGAQKRSTQRANQALLPSFGALRIDRMRRDFLVGLADHPMPIMVVTPNGSLSAAWIVECRETWTPEDGRSTPIFISCLECRIAGPAYATAIKDLDTLEPGNTTNSSGGEQAGKNVGQTTADPGTGLAPETQSGSLVPA